MIRCPKCSAEVPDESRFCLSCGEPLSSPSQMPTVAAPEPASPDRQVDAPHVGRLISSDSVPAGGFTPGTILAERYRVIGLLGRGGMGEVYRADDLKLGQPVALKFLPRTLADDPVRRERLFAEVRIARQVSHPNICRVYDIGELEGRHFLTMEYIDGEDLASLLKRIGSLHGAKAIDVARQLCAGLAAAHDKGVLHRDLKPANVMIDSRGRVRITDFGLAVAAEEDAEEGDISGTPPYMAPEQFEGKGASVRSDIYALGLVFYELFTGRCAFEAKTLAELREKKETSSPRAPSEITRDIDPVVERVILRCIEKDPRQRPASAAQVASALPGGDPLSAAIAAGETPSPEMVAASGSTEGLRPWIAWAGLAFILLSIGTLLVLTRQNSILSRVTIEERPAVMVKMARNILKDAGYTDEPADSAFAFESDSKYFDYVGKNDQSPDRFEKIPALTIQFWYRQSPMLLSHMGLDSGVTLEDPPFTNNGESIVWLDSQGNLTGLRVIPSKESQEPGDVEPFEWSLLFKAAGLDEDDFNPVEQPEFIPPMYADTRAAWTGKLPDFPETEISIEAASWQGKPVFWNMTVPSWNNFSTADIPPGQVVPGTGTKAGDIIAVVIAVLVLVTAPIFFARRNLRMGRGDRSGAARLVFFTFTLLAVSWVFSEHHIAAINEALLLALSTAVWLLIMGWVWLLYIAFEPFARRRWPGVLVGWSRLLAGNYRDPLVGRDLFVGFLTAAVAVILFVLVGLFRNIESIPQTVPDLPVFFLFNGPHMIVKGILMIVGVSVLYGLAIAFVVFLLRILLRSTWVTGIVAALLVALISFITTSSVIETILAALVIGLLLFVFIRFGLLAIMAYFLYFLIFDIFPVAAQVSDWYFETGLTGIAVLVAFILYAFYTSLGGQPLFGRASLED